jgi:hypothetical protein
VRLHGGDVQRPVGAERVTDEATIPGGIGLSFGMALPSLVRSRSRRSVAQINQSSYEKTILIDTIRGPAI